LGPCNYPKDVLSLSFAGKRRFPPAKATPSSAASTHQSAPRRQLPVDVPVLRSSEEVSATVRQYRRSLQQQHRDDWRACPVSTRAPSYSSHWRRKYMCNSSSFAGTGEVYHSWLKQFSGSLFCILHICNLLIHPSDV